MTQPSAVSESSQSQDHSQERPWLITQELLDFISASPTSFQATANFAEMLQGAGFIRLEESQSWELEPDQGYFVTRNQSSVIAFRTPAAAIHNAEAAGTARGTDAASACYTGFQIGAAHTDSPLFKIKSNPEINFADTYVKLNVEKYGGMLCAPWLDRPLSVAGRVVVRTSQGIRTRLVDLKKNVALIPNLAIHMNRAANDGVALSVQTDMLPLVGTSQTEGSLMNLVAQAASSPDCPVQTSDIIAHDLFVVSNQPGCIWGVADEFASSPQLDDLQCAFSLMKALVRADANPAKVQVCALFDNEEVGSGTKQGADSTFLADVLVRINQALGGTPDTLRQVMTGSFMVSADNAHSVHPNHPEKADPVNRPRINQGVVVKHSANQKYTTDAVSHGVFRAICQKAGVPVQEFTNHSDVLGGSTLGNISNAHVSLNTVDVGLPQLAMHSPYETCGVRDTAYLIDAMTLFFMTQVDMDRDGDFRLVMPE